MPSRRLDPVAQWAATARLAVEWERQARRIIARFPTLEAPWDQWHAAFEGIASELAPTTRRKSIKNYLDMLSGIGQFESWRLGKEWRLGRATRNDRHLVKDDLVLVQFDNGTDRHPVWCVSSKGHRLSGYYYDTDRSGLPAMIELLVLPVEFAGLQPAGPDAKRFVAACAQALVRVRVGASSPEPTPHRSGAS